MAAKAIPDGYHVVTPYLIVRGVPGLIDFMTRAFQAEVHERMETPDGTVMHAEVKIGDSIIMMGEASEKYPPMPGGLYLYVKDTDAVYRRALEAGAVSLM
jgi:PhnB protein